MRRLTSAAVCLGLALGLAVSSGRAEEAASPPDPPQPSPRGGPRESDVDALPRGDARRADLLLELALSAHRKANDLELEERRAHAEAVARSREPAPSDGRGGEAPPALATPRSDAQRAEAVRLAQRALEESPEFAGAAQALLIAGADAERIGRRKEALRMLAALVRGFPESSLAAHGWLALGELHLASGDLTKARAALESARRSGPAEVAARSAARMAEVSLAAGDADGAVDALGRALEAGSEHALSVLDGLAAAPDPVAASLDALTRLAELCERSGEVGRADLLRQRLPKAAGRGRPRAASDGASRRSPAGAPPQLPGRMPLRTSSPAGEDDERPERRLAAFAGDAAALHGLALGALEAGQAGDARTLVERALGSGLSSPSRTAAMENDLGVTLFALGDVAGARAALERAAERDPGLAAAQQNLGAIALLQREPALAESALARAAALEPWRWQARLLRALALEALRRTEEALVEAERVLELEPEQPAAAGLAESLRERAAAPPAGTEQDSRWRGARLAPPYP